MKQLFKSLLILIATLTFLNACKRKPDGAVVRLNNINSEAVGPYFTQDGKGNPVLCWTEKGRKDSVYKLRYAIYNNNSDSFNSPVTIAGSEGTGISAESMGKVAFKTDGTIMAVFEKRFKNEKNRFAGAIYYSFSGDKGKSWSKPLFLHSDTSHTYGRSFFDVATLKNGELAAVWLDGRFKKTIKGSALFFARTLKGQGFGMDTCLEKGTCECCRTAILTDKGGNIHIAYRSIMFPSALLGKQVRDMVYTCSKDNGKTFIPVKTISKDNWAIEGCPHSGPTLAITKNTINAVWFTAGGIPGLYYTSSQNPEADFRERMLLTTSGRHPQMISLPDGKLAMVCEETADTLMEAPMNMDSSHGAMVMKHSPATAAKIILRILRNGNVEKTIPVTNGHQSDHHAVITSTKEGLLIAWIRENNGHSDIYYSRIKSIN